MSDQLKENAEKNAQITLEKFLEDFYETSYWDEDVATFIAENFDKLLDK